MKKRGTVLIYLSRILIISLIWITQPVIAQHEEPNIIALLQSALNTAIKTFNSQNQPEAILQFNQIIHICQENMSSRELSDDEKNILAQAYDYRGRAFFNIGETEKAQSDFTELIKLNPRYEMDSNLVSPKIISLYDKNKSTLVGNLAVFSTPSGSEVFINGKLLSLTPLYATELLKGEYTLEVRHRGYDVYTEVLSILPNTPLEKEISLVPNTGTCFFMTSPPDAKIYIDDEFVGTTFGQAPPDMEELATKVKVTLQALSAPLRIDYITPGTHRLEIKKECFEPVTRSIAVEIREQLYEPFVLESSRTSIQVKSTVPGASVYIGEAFQGITPLTLPDVCTGTYLLSVRKEKVGKWFQEVTLKRNEAQVIETTMRPTLTFFGVINANEREAHVLQRVYEKINPMLKQLQSVNVRILNAEQLAGLTHELGLPPASITGFEGSGGSMDAKKRETMLAALGQKLQTDLLLFAYLPKEKLQRHLFFELYSTYHDKADLIKIAFNDPESLGKFSETFDHKLEITRNWVGLVMVDTYLHKGIMVVNVMPDSPAKKAGIQVGDLVTKINNQTVTSNRDFLKLLASVSKGDEIKVSFTHDGIVNAAGLKVAETPLELPRNSPHIYYNKALAALKQMVLMEKDPDLINIYRLNLGFCYMHFLNWQKAIEDAFSITSMTTGAGISAGTLNYYIAICYLNIGYQDEARKFFQAAAASFDATIESNDGPSVAFLAKKKLEELH